jgi:hypothetical protein
MAMPDTWEVIDSNLEPAAKLVDYKMKARISTAISIKRIADALENVNIDGRLNQLTDAIYMGIKNAR